MRSRGRISVVLILLSLQSLDWQSFALGHPRLEMSEATSVLEVEQKFRCSDEIMRKLEGLEVASRHRMHDVYFDTEELTLTTKDYWLRMRNGALELKAPFPCEDKRDSNLYVEVTALDGIAKELATCGISPEELPTWPKTSKRLRPFANILTRRTRYTVDVSESTVKCRVFVDVDQVPRKTSNFN